MRMATNDSFQLERYEIVEKIAVGGMAAIYLAKLKTNRFQNKLFVIKKVLDEYADQTEFLVYLKDEAKVLSLINHGNIIAFQDFFYEDNQFFLVMEYVHGKSLREIVLDLHSVQKKLSIEHTLYIISEIAAGLDFAHRSYDQLLQKSLNLVHRDVNPQNIMISYDGQVKIIDFGISKFDIRDDHTRTGMLKGKFSYMSPEQVEAGHLDSRTDIFALGIILWELLASKRLFDGNDDYEKVNKIKDHKVPSLVDLNSEVQVELDEIVKKALAQKPEDRYQTASELKHALTKFLFEHYPDFRSEHFRNYIKTTYQFELKISVERLKKYFDSNELLDQETQMDIDFEQKLNQRQSYSSKNKNAIHVPNDFENKIKKSKLISDISTADDRPHELSKKKRHRLDKKDRPTMVDPNRYKVQLENIQTSQIHIFINSRPFKIFIFSFYGLAAAYALYVTWKIGYIHSAYKMSVTWLKANGYWAELLKILNLSDVG